LINLENFPPLPAVMPRLATLLTLVAVLALAAGTFYSLKLDPEISYWAAASELKLDWVEEMRRKHGYVIGVVGGSTTTFGIDAERMHEEYNLPVANLGLHAGMGPDACVGLGFLALQRGDTLMLSLEPSMLSKEDDISTSRLGSKLAARLREPRLLNWRPSQTSSLHGTPIQLQPGGYHTMTMLGKLVLSKPLYRYTIDEMRPGGLQVTSERPPLSSPADPTPVQLSASGRKLLEALKKEADQRGIDLFYLLPWSYSPEEIAAKQRAVNARFLAQVQAVIPAIQEGALGVHTSLQDFADTTQHLTEDAAARRSDVLALLLQAMNNSR
jgi:hypothetical protein